MSLTQGILVGCDAEQQWLLPWWWNRYRRHNTLPVVFFDFGMSEEAQAWCRARGHYLRISDSETEINSDIPTETQTMWEAHYGAPIWHIRKQWYKKPQAFLQSPFSIGLWVDLDCDVRTDVTPLFAPIEAGSDIALAADAKSGDARCFNSGVVAFRHNAPILQQWHETYHINRQQCLGDQDALNRAIAHWKPPLTVLPPHYNWHSNGSGMEKALIMHYCAGWGKKAIIAERNEEDWRGAPFAEIYKEVAPALLHALFSPHS